MTLSPKLFSAILAMDSYNRGYDEGILLPVSLNNTQIGNATITAQSDPTIGGNAYNIGFYALTYDTNGDGISDVLAYRGTDYPQNDNAFPKDIKHGWSLGFRDLNSEQAHMAIEFYQAVISSGATNISLTGHSLGGGLSGFVGTLYDQDAYIFDAMAFEDPANDLFNMSQNYQIVYEKFSVFTEDWVLTPETLTPSTYDSRVQELMADQYVRNLVDARGLVYGGGSPTGAPDTNGIIATHINGEVLTYAQDKFNAYNLARVVNSTPLYELDGIDLVSGLSSEKIARHSMSSMAILLFADEPEVQGRDWENAAKYFWPVLYDTDFAGNIGFDQDPSVAGELQAQGQYSDILRDTIAYSAIDEGTTIYGDTAIRALYNDANNFGKVAQETSYASVVTSYEKEISEVFVHFSALLALNKTKQSDVPGAVFVNGILNDIATDFIFTINVNNDFWNQIPSGTAGRFSRDELILKIIDEAGPNDNLLAFHGDYYSSSTVFTDIEYISFQRENINLSTVDLPTNFAPDKLALVVGTTQDDTLVQTGRNIAYVAGEGIDTLDYSQITGGITTEFISDNEFTITRLTVNETDYAKGVEVIIGTADVDTFHLIGAADVIVEGGDSGDKYIIYEVPDPADPVINYNASNIGIIDTTGTGNDIIFAEGYLPENTTGVESGSKIRITSDVDSSLPVLYFAKGIEFISPATGTNIAVADYIDEDDPPPPEEPTLPGILGPLFDQAANTGSPLIFDLGTSGIDLISLDDPNSVNWDIDVDGFAESSGWIGSTDGFLAIDLNSDGVINNHSELFGDLQTDGFTALSNYDTNGDDLITVADAQFNDLLVWVDANSDAVSQAQELKSLSYYNITEISLADTVVDYMIAGNIVTNESTFVMNGQTRQIIDAWFAYDNVDTSYVGTSAEYANGFNFDVDAFSLPNLKGWGILPDLHIAMSQDSTLKEMVQEYTKSYTGAFEDILFQWAGVQNVDPASRNSYVDARKLIFMEMVLDESFRDGDNTGNAPFRLMEKTFNDEVLPFLQTQFLAQTAVQHLDFLSYDEFSGALVVAENTPDFSINLLSETISQNYYFGAEDNFIIFNPSHVPATISDEGGNDTLILQGVEASDIRLSGTSSLRLSMFVGLEEKLVITDFDQTGNRVETIKFNNGEVIDLTQGLTLRGDGTDNTIYGFENNDTIYGEEGDDTLRGQLGDDSLYGGTGNDSLQGNEGNDVLNGGEGNDSLTDYDGNNTFIGGAGNDVLRGGSGIDTYLWNLGDGNDQIIDTALDNKIVFGENITLSDLAFGESVYNNSFLILVGSNVIQVEDNFTIVNDEKFNGKRIHTIEFFDGSTLDVSTINNLPIYGTTGIDNIQGTDRDNDFVWNIGDGNDIINETGGFDRILFGEGITPGDVTLEVLANINTEDLFIHIGSETIVLNRQFDFNGGSTFDPLYQVEKAVFQDGTEWDLTIRPFTEIIGSDVETYQDSLNGTPRNDRLDGQKGDDYIYGRDGDDEYIWNIGDGNDYFDEWSGNDAIVFGEGISPEDVSLSFSGDDLLLNVHGAFLRLHDQFVNHIYGNSTIVSEDDQIEEARFADGSVISLNRHITITGTEFSDTISTFDDSNDTLIGLAGNDSLSAWSGNDTLIGGLGDDILIGGAGDDKYYWSVGDGNDIIRSENGGNDQLYLSGVLAGDIRFEKSSDDLKLHINNEVITIERQFYGDNRSSYAYEYMQIEEIVFDDTSSMNLKGSFTFIGTGSNDYMSSLNLNNSTMIGLQGDDSFLGGVGSAQDTVKYFGQYSNYTIIKHFDEFVTVEDNVGTDGYDDLDQIEFIQFADGNYNVATETFTPNAHPVAADDTFTIYKNSTLGGNVLNDNGNGADSDADSDPLTVISATLASLHNGNVTLNTDGSFTYIPPSDFTGTDTFDYTVEDGQGGSDTGTVSLNVVNGVPSASKIYRVINEDGSSTFNPLNYASDPDGDILTISSFPTSLSNGTIIWNANGTVTITPNANYNGSIAFTYSVTDGNGGSDTDIVKVVVNPVNDAPLAKDDNFIGTQNNQITGNVLNDNGNGFDSDLEGDTLNAVAGTYATAQGGSIVLNSDGSFTYTPLTDFIGTDTLNAYTLEDGNGGSDTAIINFTINVPSGDPIAPTQDRVYLYEDGVALTGLPNSTSINEADFLQKTQAISFTTGSDVTSTQILYEQGGTVRGLNIFIENGKLFAAVWNYTEEAWGYHELESATITSNTNYTATLVMDGIMPANGSANLYLNGTLVSTASGIGKLYNHVGAIGIGGVNDNTTINDQSFQSPPYANFGGSIEKLAQYNAALGGTELNELHDYMAFEWLGEPVGDVNGTSGDDVLHGHTLDSAEVTQILNNNSGVIYNASSNSFYKFIDSEVSYATASTNAASSLLEGVAGHIITITSAAENSFLTNNIPYRVWTAGADANQDGVWIWTEGIEAGMQFSDQAGQSVNGMYHHWDTGQPENNNEYQAVLYTHSNWHDWQNSASHRYMIEWDAGLINDDNSSEVIYGRDGNDMLFGYGGDDILYGQDGIDNLIGGAGADTFVFESASAFNDIDIIHDFSIAEGDMLDLSDLVSAYDPITDAITDFIQITDNGTHSTLSVDTDGGADNFIAIAEIKNVTGLTDEEALETSGNLIVV